MLTPIQAKGGTPTATDPALAEAVRRLVEGYRPLRAYLFGSVARGAGPDSDYDILLVVSDGTPSELRGECSCL